jgi:HJR/Mrr/RecB family endonuclease
VLFGIAVFSPRLAFLLELVFLSIVVLMYASAFLLKERGFWPNLVAKTTQTAASTEQRFADFSTRVARVELALEQVKNHAEGASRESRTANETYKLWQRALALKRTYDSAQAKHGELLRIIQSKRYQLLNTKWKSLRGVEFELFLKEVFEMLGFVVTLTKTSGDQGIDLIVTGDGRVIGVQAKGYHDSVGNHAVMEAHAGMAHYRCHCSVVVTNSTFTRSAKDLATSVNCRLISGDELPDLILGNLSL